MKDYKPAALKDAKLFQSQVVWSDVGGLKEVRSVLKDTWSTNFICAIVLKSTNQVAIQSLPFGPQDVEKLLAGAVANECGLNFISVKGPEILDKYIGA